MIGRFAPTPSGRLHLGNLLCAMLAYLSARSQGGQFLLRIEDVDIPRCPRALAQQAIDDLRFLGFRWDAPPLYQSAACAAKGMCTRASAPARSCTRPSRRIWATRSSSTPAPARI